MTPNDGAVERVQLMQAGFNNARTRSRFDSESVHPVSVRSEDLKAKRKIRETDLPFPIVGTSKPAGRPANSPGHVCGLQKLGILSTLPIRQLE